MGIAISDFVKAVGQTKKLLNRAYQDSDKRTKCSTLKIIVSSLSRNHERTEAFNDLQARLTGMVKMTSEDPALRFCVYKGIRKNRAAGVGQHKNVRLTRTFSRLKSSIYEIFK